MRSTPKKSVKLEQKQTLLEYDSFTSRLSWRRLLLHLANKAMVLEYRIAAVACLSKHH
jgi:hypothetical protein